MYVLEYLIYHLRPYGVTQNIDQSTINKIYLNKENNVTKTDQPINKTQNV